MMIHYSSDTFSNSNENMNFDRDLLEQASTTTSNIYLRIYTWSVPGITIPEKRTLPPDLSHCDSSTRPTGGGVVFHAPGDLVFCLIFPLKSPLFPGTLKEKLLLVSTWIRNSLSEQDVHAHHTQENKDYRNLQFCKGYFSPSELYIGSEKICGLTLRRFRKHVMIQGILHLKDSEKAFPNLLNYHLFFSKGLDIDGEKLKTDLFSNFKSQFELRTR